MKPLILVLPITVVLIVCSGTNAQTANSQPAPVPHGMIAIPIDSLIPPVKNAPFSSVRVFKSEQTLDDGTHIVREDEVTVMRDSLGRVYCRRMIKRPGSSGEYAGAIVTIVDPSQHIEYHCGPAKVCRSMPYRDRFRIRRPRGPGSNKNPNVTVEDLGSSNISGLEVDGQRITRVIPEGTIGNDRAFTTTEETWHSKQLDLDVQFKRSDPRFGVYTTTLSDVLTGEPDGKYFQIPEGYRVEPIGQTPLQPGLLAPLPPLPPSQ